MCNRGAVTESEPRMTRMTRTGRNSKDASLRPTVCSAETRPTRGSKPNVDGSISCLGRRRAALSLRDTDQLRPIELWFYSGEREYPELPAFFNLLFYQRDEIGDCRRYIIS